MCWVWWIGRCFTTCAMPCGAQDIAKQLHIVEEIVVSGKDLSQFVQDILRYFRNLLVCKTADPTDLIALPDEEIAEMQARADALSLTTLIRLVEQFAELAKGFDSQLAQRIALESLLIRISKVAEEVSLDAVLDKLAALGVGGLTSVPQSSRPGGPPLPPNPSGAAPREPGPGRAADISPSDDEGRIHVTQENLSSVWAQLAHELSAQNLNLGVALGYAEPTGIRGETIQLRFAAHQTRARDLIERPDQRDIVREALARTTANLTGFETEVFGGPPAPKREEGQATIPRGGSVSAEEAKQALEDPHVAQVVDVFKGRIVAVRHGAEPS